MVSDIQKIVIVFTQQLEWEIGLFWQSKSDWSISHIISSIVDDLLFYLKISNKHEHEQKHELELDHEQELWLPGAGSDVITTQQCVAVWIALKAKFLWKDKIKFSNKFYFITYCSISEDFIADKGYIFGCTIH
jgi:hypothetical protein